MDQNAKISFEFNNPYPRQKGKGASARPNPRWALYEKYKMATDFKSARKKGASKQCLRQDLNMGILEVASARERVMETICPTALAAVGINHQPGAPSAAKRKER